jgi:hypothetical protein
MRRFHLHALLVAALLVAGCAGPQPDPCAIGEWNRSTTIDEIDAAGRLDFDPSRAELLHSIAGRRGLIPVEQEHLVCVTLHRVQFDPARVDILRALIQNPDFAESTKSVILKNLDAVDFPPARADLIREMQGKPRHDAE